MWIFFFGNDRHKIYPLILCQLRSLYCVLSARVRVCDAHTRCNFYRTCITSSGETTMLRTKRRCFIHEWRSWIRHKNSFVLINPHPSQVWMTALDIRLPHPPSLIPSSHPIINTVLFFQPSWHGASSGATVKKHRGGRGVYTTHNQVINEGPNRL